MLVTPPPPPSLIVAPPPPPQIIGVDSETGLIQPALMTPPLVCVSTAVRSGPNPMDFATGLMNWADGIAFYRRALTDPNITIIIHNGPFDLATGVAEDQEHFHPFLSVLGEDLSLLPLVFDAIDQGRAICTVTLQKLIDVALGQRKFRRYRGKVVKSAYYLKDLIEMYYEEIIEKEDTWRMSYQFLRDVPVEKWPPNARRYAIYDAVLHLRLFEAQKKKIKETWGELPNQVEQQRANWVLHLMSLWGLRADQKAVDVFVGHCQEQIDKMRSALAETNILKADGSRFMEEIKRRIVASLTRKGMAVPMTPPSAKYPHGQVRTNEDTLRLTDDPKLHVLAATLTFQKHLGQWGPVVRAAVKRPVCCRYNVIVDNGRTSCSGGEGQEGTNIQNPPRKGDVRPCFIPRIGWVYCSTDADTVEMRANAQNAYELVGWSKMRDALWDQFSNGGPDLHVRLAANVAAITAAVAHELHKSGDAEFKNTRQMSKHGNFAFLGGAGGRRFAGMAHGFGLALTQTYNTSYEVPGDACPVFMDEYDPETDKMKTVTKWVSFEAEVGRALLIKEMFLETWPEERIIFKLVKQHLDKTDVAKQLQSNRIRGDCTFTSLANSLFSGRVADSMKEILWNLGLESYLGRCTTKHVHGSDFCSYTGRSCLYGSRTVMFLHDEPIMEHPEATSAERAEKQRIVVVDGLSAWMKDVPVTSQAVLMRRWQKGAEPGFLCHCGKFSGKKNCECGSLGKLVPVRPEKIKVDGKEKVKWVHDTGEDLLIAA